MGKTRDVVRGFVLGLMAVAPRFAWASGPPRVEIDVYDGYGDSERVTVAGRVLEADNAKAPAADDSASHNIARTLTALESDEVKDASVVVTLGAATATATTDDDGVFRVDLKSPPGVPFSLGTHDVSVRLAAPRRPAQAASARVVVLPRDRPFTVVVSDVDDTVVKTNVTDKRAMAETVLFKNALQLDPVVGAARAYAHAGAAGASAFFYLSGSPQNFHRRLRTFLDAHAFPRGPLLLKNLGEDSLLKQQGYKGERLRQLLERFPLMRVLLIGDTGEKDPEIYRALQHDHPERVIGIVVRKVPGQMVAAERVKGMTVIDDTYPTEDLLGALLRSARDEGAGR